MSKTPKEEIAVPSGVNEPMTHRCIIVKVQAVQNGPQDCVEIEEALHKLNDEAIQTGRVVLSVQFFATTLIDSCVLYTILAQWMGREAMEKLSRLQQLGQSAHVPGGRPQVVR